VQKSLKIIKKPLTMLKLESKLAASMLRQAVVVDMRQTDSFKVGQFFAGRMISKDANPHGGTVSINHPRISVG